MGIRAASSGLAEQDNTLTISGQDKDNKQSACLS